MRIPHYIVLLVYRVSWLVKLLASAVRVFVCKSSRSGLEVIEGFLLTLVRVLPARFVDRDAVTRWQLSRFSTGLEQLMKYFVYVTALLRFHA